MADNELPDDTRVKMGFQKAMMGATAIYSIAAIFQISIAEPNPYQPDEPFALDVAAVFLVISFTCAVSQLILLQRIELKGRQEAYLEAFRKSGHFAVVFIAALLAAFLGTCALLIHFAVWLLVPLVICSVFLVWFLGWQEEQLTPEQDPSPTVTENKD